MSIKVGDTAPDFTLPNQDGTPIHLKALLEKGPVVLYFYPKDHTPGCTAEACAFRDAYEDFKGAGAEVVGVSTDSAKTHEGFVSKHKLPFVLLTDDKGALSKTYGVGRSLLGLLPGRVTYVIDKDGVVRHLFNSQLQATRHVKEAVEVIKTLKS